MVLWSYELHWITFFAQRNSKVATLQEIILFFQEQWKEQLSHGFVCLVEKTSQTGCKTLSWGWCNTSQFTAQKHIQMWWGRSSSDWNRFILSSSRAPQLTGHRDVRVGWTSSMQGQTIFSDCHRLFWSCPWCQIFHNSGWSRNFWRNLAKLANQQLLPILDNLQRPTNRGLQRRHQHESLLWITSMKDRATSYHAHGMEYVSWNEFWTLQTKFGPMRGATSSKLFSSSFWWPSRIILYLYKYIMGVDRPDRKYGSFLLGPGIIKNGFKHFIQWDEGCIYRSMDGWFCMVNLVGKYTVRAMDSMTIGSITRVCTEVANYIPSWELTYPRLQARLKIIFLGVIWIC